MTSVDKSTGHGLSVAYDLLLVIHKLGSHRLLESDRFCGDHMHERSTLCAGEYCRVELLFQRFVGFRQNQARARPTQGFVGSCGHDVCMRNGAWIDARRNQTGHVSHIHQQVRPDFVRDLAKFRPIEDAAVCGKSANDELRSMRYCELAERVVIQQARVMINAVLHRVVDLPGKIDGGAMCQVPPIRQAHTQYRIAGLQQSLKHSDIGTGPRVRLHIGKVGTK